MVVKELAERLREFEEEGLGAADVCIVSEDDKFEGIEEAELDRTGALAIVVLIRERRGGG